MKLVNLNLWTQQEHSDYAVVISVASMFYEMKLLALYETGFNLEFPFFYPGYQLRVLFVVLFYLYLFGERRDFSNDIIAKWIQHTLV